MTAPDITAAMPAGWTWDHFDDIDPSVLCEDGVNPVTIYAATCLSRPKLYFEATSPEDMLDQVHEALDAWQTELELASARQRVARWRPEARFG